MTHPQYYRSPFFFAHMATYVLVVAAPKTRPNFLSLDFVSGAVSPPDGSVLIGGGNSVCLGQKNHHSRSWELPGRFGFGLRKVQNANPVSFTGKFGGASPAPNSGWLVWNGV